MIKSIALFVFCLFAYGIAAAEPFDLKLCTAVLLDGNPFADGCINYHGLDAGGLELVNSKTDAITNAVINSKDSKGPYTVVLSGSVTDLATGKVSPSDDLKVSGFSLKDLAKLMRVEHQAGDQLIKVAEGHAAKGKSRPWGKNAD